MLCITIGHDAPDKENLDPNETDDWLHRNDSLHGNNLDDICNSLSGNSPVINMATMHKLIVDRYLVCSGCLAIILTQTQLCRW